MKDESIKSIKVEILGKNYPLKVKEGQEATMRKIARYVDQRFRAFKQDLKNQPDTTVMTLACLSITEELFEERQKNDEKSEQKKRIYTEMNDSLREIIHNISS